MGGLGLGWEKWVEALGLLGRAWVISLPKIFLGNSFQFWKLPPYFCIKNRDNVYYPIFLACYMIRITGIKYTVICITGISTLVKIPLKSGRFC